MMKLSEFTEEQIIGVLHEQEADAMMARSEGFTTSGSDAIHVGNSIPVLVR